MSEIKTILEGALLENALKKDTWLVEELIKGLNELGVKVFLEEECVLLNEPFKTILRIETSDGRKYAAGLRQQINLKVDKP